MTGTRARPVSSLAATRAVAGAAFRRVAHDRTALFFLVVLPILVILIVGASVSEGETFRVGLADGDRSTESRALTTMLAAEPALEVHAFDDVDGVRTALRRGEVDGAVVLPPGLGADAASGRPYEVGVLGEQTNATHRAAREAVAAVVSQRSALLQAARAHADASGSGPGESLAVVADLAQASPALQVDTEVVDAESGYLPGGFSYSAPTMLVLFVFVTSLAGGGALIHSRELGIHDRALAGPVRPRSIVVGESASYLGIALVQSVLIVGVGALLFGVDWGDPLAAAVLVGVWALVGSGAGMVAGTVFRTADQAMAVGTAGGVAMGMLGGCMWPLEIVSDAMRVVGHAVPHAWAVDAWIEVLSRGGGVGDIATELAVLLAFAAALLGLSSWRLRRRLVA